MSLIFRPTRDGSPNLFDTHLNLFVHSAYDPLKESSRLILSNFSEHKIPAVYGFGAGYLIKNLIENFQFNSDRIYCIRSGLNEEQIPEIQQVLQNLQKSALLKGKTVHFCDSSEIQGDNYNIYTLPYFIKRKSQTEKISLKNAVLAKNEGRVNEATKSFFSRVWFRNYLINVSRYIDDISSFFLTENSFYLGGRSVLFIGASPSLEKQVNMILEKRDHFFIICSDTASRFVCRQKIVPDLILSLDSGRGTLYHIVDSFPETVPVLTWFGANREIFNLKNTKFIYLSSFPLDQILSSLSLGHLECLKNPGLNISGMAKSVSAYLKSASFVTAGTGFRSEDGKSHCTGTGYERFYQDKIMRKTSIHSLQTRIYSDKISSKNLIAENFLNSSDLIKTQTIEEFKSDSLNYEVNMEKIERLSGKDICRKLISVLQKGLYSQEIEKNSGLTVDIQNKIFKQILY